MSNFGIRHRLVGAVVLVAVIGVVIAAIGVSALRSVHRDVDRMSQHATPASVLLLNIGRDYYQAYLGIASAALAATPESRDAALADYEENVAQIEDRFAEYKALALGFDGEKAAWADYEAKFATFRESADALAAQLASGSAASLEAIGPVTEAFDASRRALDELYGSFYEAETPRIAARIDDTIDGRAAWVVGALVVMAAVSVVVGVLTVRALAPLKQITEAARGIARGDLRTRVEAIDRADEIGTLSASFTDMSEFLTDVADLLTTVAEGDLRRDASARGEADVLGNAMQRMILGLRQVVDNLKSAAGQVTAWSESLANVNADLASAVSTTATQASAIAAATTEMEATIREIASNAAMMATVTNEAEAMASGASDSIARLGESSTKIGEVTDVIASIAEQTNLLALNATIEAARAGASGKGFAVVADEVKALANQTGHATEQVREMVSAIQNDTRSAVDSIGKLLETVERIASFAATVASAVEEQQATTSEIVRGLDEVAMSADASCSATATADDAAQQLRELATQLDLAVAGFKL